MKDKQSPSADQIFKEHPIAQSIGYVSNRKPQSREHMQAMRDMFRSKDRFQVLKHLLFHSDDENNRIVAASGLGYFGHQGCSTLEHALKTDQSRKVRREAAIALGKTGNANSISSLKDALEDPDIAVRYAAAEALDVIAILATIPPPSVLEEWDKEEESGEEGEVIFTLDLEKYLLIEELSKKGFASLFMGDLEDAASKFNIMLEMAPTFSASYLGMGTVLDQQGRYSEAIPFLDKALELDPNSSMAYERRATCRRRLDDWNGALEDLERALTLDPSNTKSWYNKGTGLLHLGRKEEALSAFDESIRLAPDYPLAYFNRGSLKLQQGDAAAALEDFNTGLRLAPNVADAYYNRGHAHMMLGNEESASEDWQKAIELNPGIADYFK